MYFYQTTPATSKKRNRAPSNEELLRALAEIITEQLNRDGQFRLHQFGTFKAKWNKRSAKQTSVRIRFIAAKRIKQLLNPNPKPLIAVVQPEQSYSKLYLVSFEQWQAKIAKSTRESKTVSVLRQDNNPPSKPLANTDVGEKTTCGSALVVSPPQQTHFISRGKLANTVLIAATVLTVLMVALPSDPEKKQKGVKKAPDPVTEKDKSTTATKESHRVTVSKTDEVDSILHPMQSHAGAWERDKEDTKPVETASISKTLLPQQNTELSDEIKQYIPKVQAMQANARFEYSIHPVENGDTLWDLAQTYYGTPLVWPFIYLSNTDQLHHPNRLETGVTIKIPSYKWVVSQN